MSTTTQLSGSLATILSAELNALANNALALGAAYSSSGGYLLAEVELVVTYGVSPTTGTGVSIWFLRAIDGTNYEDGSTSATPSRPPDLVIPLEVITTAQRITRRCLLPPGTWKPLLKNDGTGQAMAATGSTVRILPLTYQTL